MSNNTLVNSRRNDNYNMSCLKAMKMLQVNPIAIIYRNMLLLLASLTYIRFFCAASVRPKIQDLSNIYPYLCFSAH